MTDPRRPDLPPPELDREHLERLTGSIRLRGAPPAAAEMPPPLALDRETAPEPDRREAA